MFGVSAADALVELLRQLPGIGPRSAQRIAYDLLVRKRETLPQLAAAMARAHGEVRRCERCNNLSDGPLCAVCRSMRRDRHLICVVESPADLMAIEATGAYGGEYFVLMGHLSPLDGIGPEALGLDRLEARLREGGIEEVILATNPTLEGEATAHFLAEMVQGQGLKVTRIARGVPVGGEIEYADRSTLGSALSGRRIME